MSVETNFLPNPFGTVDLPSRQCLWGNCSGHGAPSDGDGRDGFTYVDLDDGTFYVKESGVWVAQTAGTGAGLTYHSGAALDPNGVIVGSPGDVYFSKPSGGGDGSVWWKTSGAGNTGWE